MALLLSVTDETKFFAEIRDGLAIIRDKFPL